MIKRIDDINKEKKEQMKKEISNDLVDVFEDSMGRIEDYFKRKKISKEIAEGKKHRLGIFFWKLMGLVGFLGVIILILNFVLGNIWIFLKLIKSIFG